MTTGKEQHIQELASQGKTIVQICRALGLHWSDVRSYLRSVDKRSWRGAKVVITNRLKKLALEADPKKRQHLADEADRWVDYLYSDAKRLGDEVDQVRKALQRGLQVID